VRTSRAQQAVMMHRQGGGHSQEKKKKKTEPQWPATGLYPLSLINAIKAVNPVINRLIIS
jgi:hypothetical protein